MRPDRVAKVLKEIDADIVALQEVVSMPGGAPEDDQAHYIARAIGADFLFGENRKLWGGAYGNVVLSRLPMRAVKNHDLSVRRPRAAGLLHIDVDIAPRTSCTSSTCTWAPRSWSAGSRAASWPELDILLSNGAEGPAAACWATSTSGRPASPRGCCART